MVPSGKKLPIFWVSFSHILAKKPAPSLLACQIEQNLPDLNHSHRESVIALRGHNRIIPTFFVFSFP